MFRPEKQNIVLLHIALLGLILTAHVASTTKAYFAAITQVSFEESYISGSYKKIQNQKLVIGVFTKLQKATISCVFRPSVCLSSCPHETTWLPREGFS